MLAWLFMKNPPRISATLCVLVVCSLLFMSWPAMAGSAGPGAVATASAMPGLDCGSPPGGHSESPFVFAGNGERSHRIDFVDTTDGGHIKFFLKAGFGPAPCETADEGDTLRLEYTTDGATYLEIASFEPASFREWQEVDLDIPSAAQAAAAGFRWLQLAHDGAGFDAWALAGIRITQSHSSPFVTFDDFEDGSLNPVLWASSAGAVETNDCAPLAVGDGLLSFAAGGGHIESREFPVSASLEYRLRMLPLVNDADGFPACPVQSHPAGAVTASSTTDGTTWLAFGSYSVGEWVDAPIPIGAKAVRIDGPTHPWLLDNVWIGPASQPALGSVGDLALHSTPAFTFPGATAAVHFEYEATIDACQLARACPAPSEWRIILDGPTTDGQTTWLGGQELARGRVMHPAHGETLRHDIAATIAFDDQIPGTHKLAVAVRAPEASSTWDVRVADLKLLDRNDLDADGVPDELETELCAKPGTRDVFRQLQGSAGQCEGPDFVPPAQPGLERRVFIPDNIATGSDVDQDDVPSYAVLFGSYLVVGTGQETARMEHAEPSRVYLDLWDDNPELPLLSSFCVPVGTPSAILPGADADGDGVPGSVDVHQSAACVDRRTSPPQVWFIASANQPFLWDLDPDDSDPNKPAPQSPSNPPSAEFVVDTGDQLFFVGVSEDSDNDGIIGYFHYTTMKVSYSLTTREFRATDFSTTSLLVDADDRDPEAHFRLPFSNRDHDGDRVLDSAEGEVCEREDPRTLLDGECTILGDYHPSPAYESVMRPDSDCKRLSIRHTPVPRCMDVTSK